MSSRTRAAHWARLRCTYTDWMLTSSAPEVSARRLTAVHLATRKRLTARDEAELEQKLADAERAMRASTGNQATLRRGRQ